MYPHVYVRCNSSLILDNSLLCPDASTKKEIKKLYATEQYKYCTLKTLVPLTICNTIEFMR